MSHSKTPAHGSWGLAASVAVLAFVMARAMAHLHLLGALLAAALALLAVGGALHWTLARPVRVHLRGPRARRTGGR